MFDILLASSPAPQGGKVVTQTLPRLGLKSRREAGTLIFCEVWGPHFLVLRRQGKDWQPYLCTWISFGALQNVCSWDLTPPNSDSLSLWYSPGWYKIFPGIYNLKLSPVSPCSAPAEERWMPRTRPGTCPLGMEFLGFLRFACLPCVFPRKLCGLMVTWFVQGWIPWSS